MNKTEFQVHGTSNTFAVVRSLLREQGLDLSPAGEKYVAETFADKIKIGPDHKVTVRDETELNRSADLRDRLKLLVVERKELFLVGSGNDAKAPEAANPWTKAGWNVTRQYALEKSDPAKALQLQEDAR